MKRAFILVGTALFLLGVCSAAWGNDFTLEGRASMWERSGKMASDDIPAEYARLEVELTEAGLFDPPFNVPEVVHVVQCIQNSYPRMKSKADREGWNNKVVIPTRNNPGITVERQAFMNCAYPLLRRRVQNFKSAPVRPTIGIDAFMGRGN